MSALSDKNLKVIVVIPCLNEEKHIGKLLDSLLAANQNSSFTYIVVDGGSRDQTVSIVSSIAETNPRIVLMHNPQKIQSAAVNMAVAAYGEGADYLIRIDAHSDYPDNFCAALIDDALQTGAASVVVAMKTEGCDGFQRAVALAQNSKFGNGGSAHRKNLGTGQWIDHGHHALMRVNAFQDVGGYDETFAANEDAELDTRLGLKGYRIWLTGNTFLTYYPRDNAPALFRQYRGYGFGRASTLIKHGLMPKIRQLLPVFVAPAALMTLLMPIHVLFGVPFFAWLCLCLGYAAWLAVRENDRSFLMAGPAALIMHFSWSVGFWQAILLNRKKLSWSPN